MRDSTKTKAQLISEVEELRQRVKELEREGSRGKYLEDILQASQYRLKYLLTYSKALIYSTKIQNDKHNFTLHSVDFVSDNIRQVLGYEPHEITGDPAAWMVRVHPDDAALFDINAKRLFKEGHQTSEYRFRDLDGNWHWFHDEMRLIHDKATGQPYEVVGVCFDITNRKQMEEELRLLSVTDQLTGLYNRRGFIAFAEQQLKLTARRKRGLLLFFADLDGMKAINDNFGHEEGDRALLETANILRETFRETDILARIGGDEFAILTIDSPEMTADILIDRLQTHIEAHNALKDKPFAISMSIGMSTCDSKAMRSLDELMSMADKKMYENKKRKSG
ncbi:MAG: sensor domain-containing diguanylate cyclase [Deltaproteobacteria bacterium]|nr:sensor domain-containing diguanylate cyclase [Deltaproteobacteria bacterium]